MATVRHHLCRIDFDPSDITGTATIRVSDLDGVEIDTIDVRTTHLISAVTKLMMVQVRRHTALAAMIGAMDDEINADRLHESETTAIEHAKVCVVVGSHDRSECIFVNSVRA